MFYLIGGSPRTGKSILTQKLIERHPMTSFSCDYLYKLDQVKQLYRFSGAGIIEKGEEFFPTLKELLEAVNERSQDSVIEGEVILPRHVHELSKWYDICSCFLGLSEASLDTIIGYGGFFNWPKDKSKKDVADLAEKVMARSVTIKSECARYGLKYFDMAKNYTHVQDEAISYLLSS